MKGPVISPSLAAKFLHFCPPTLSDEFTDERKKAVFCTFTETKTIGSRTLISVDDVR